ncbi:MAG: hypothetical protein LBU53_05355 [Zoogloeaceae bacterium]|nr:hypothetical protein [Zoogloeaceae bacterium]
MCFDKTKVKISAADRKTLNKKKRKIFLIVGFLSLFNAVSDTIQEKWEPSFVKWGWFSDLLIACFGKYGFVAFEFTVAVIFFWCWFSTEK